jgi:pyrroline-5-carboxylate reductase
MTADNITLTRRKLEPLTELAEAGFQTSIDNANAVQNAGIILLTVLPSQLMDLLDDISSSLSENHLLISIVSGVSITEIQEKVGKDIPIIRAMPNTAAVLCESMTCLSSLPQFSQELKTAQTLFEKVGNTLVIDETQMASATALCACGVAFFLRAIRAASQGGIEIGFHSDEAFTIAAQTARGAATLLLDNDSHPEAEIDQVTTPMGATIAGLNEMEHQGFSSAMIRGITTSTEKVTRLYKKD